jgi:hypothetical protein
LPLINSCYAVSMFTLISKINYSNLCPWNNVYV